MNIKTVHEEGAQQARRQSMNNNNLTKKDLALQVAQATGVAQNVALEVVQKTFEAIVKALRQGRTLEFRGFGTFEVRERAARVGRNPRAPEKDIAIPAHRVVKFRPGRALKELIGK